VAQIVEWSEDNVEYTQGPFVVTRMSGGRCRIEVEFKGHKCPVLPDITIVKFVWAFAPADMQNDGTMVSTIELVDWLNSQVREGVIELDGSCWIAPVIQMMDILER
jgi:hypothetical protein